MIRSRTEPCTYEGMDRPRIGEFELPEAPMFRGLDIEELAPKRSVAPWRELLAAIEEQGGYAVVPLHRVRASTPS